MAVNEVGHKPLSEATNRFPSNSIWGGLPLSKWSLSQGGVLLHDDFINTPTLSADADTAKYASYIDTGVTITQLASEVGGVLRITHDGTDNDEGSITTGGNTGGFVKIPTTAQKIVAFEARIRKSSVADDGIGFFIGLSEEGLAAADTLVDNTAEVASKDLVGFRVKSDNGEELDFVWRTAGQAVQEHAAIDSLAADTWVKVGFLFNPNHSASKRIKIFINEIEYTSYVTQTQIEAATFPAGEELAALWATKIGTASAFTMDLDWWMVGYAG